MKLANGIQFNDGTNLEDFKAQVDSLSGVPIEGSSNTDTSYVDNKICEVKSEIETEVKSVDAKIEELKTTIAGISIPDISGLVKEEDVDSKIATVVASLNQLIADLQSGKYNVGVASTVTDVSATPQ